MHSSENEPLQGKRSAKMAESDRVEGPMGRKGEVERFELTTELMNSEKLKE